MARPNPIDFRTHLTSLFPPARLEALARETGAYQRERKIGMNAALVKFVEHDGREVT